ncbi:microtubule-associated protein TORTIFOLIA1-like [Gossypium australe]|uniref:Microtubule-associated protein TORTIFOLIA1-like n=1 Tax=Gossypium australe TaxID=47621 RepID=A0A5B6UGS9_9ROSI|nr:microtubule-associated protein TORTIFOLIA1-like [Gossypium australe]
MLYYKVVYSKLLAGVLMQFGLNLPHTTYRFASSREITRNVKMLRHMKSGDRWAKPPDYLQPII